MIEPQVLAYSAADAYRDLLSSFELKGTPSPIAIIAAALRRLCGFACPCPQSALVRMAYRSLSVLPLEPDELRAHVETVLEDLIVCGDLLELAHMAISGGENHPHWLYCAPPSYVRRGDRIYIFGIAADDARFLPGELRVHVQHEGALRFLDVSSEPTLAEQLSSLGLREVSADAWMASTSRESARQVVDRYTKRLLSMGVAGDLPAVSLLLPNTQQQRVPYSARWAQAHKESGHFVTRAPQPYGTPLWYFCAMEAGIVKRSLLLPLKDSTERASDTAWRLQLALDATAGNPANYSIRRELDGTGALFCFDFPLPLAARRRLLVLGARRIESNPYQFWLPTAELAFEKEFLREYYWFGEPTEDTA